MGRKRNIPREPTTFTTTGSGFTPAQTHWKHNASGMLVSTKKSSSA